MFKAINRMFALTAVVGALSVASGCAVAPATEGEEKAPAAAEATSSSADAHAAAEGTKVGVDQAAKPELTCKAPLILCSCYYESEGEYESWCTTEAACLRVCPVPGGRVY